MFNEEQAVRDLSQETRRKDIRLLITVMRHL